MKKIISLALFTAWFLGCGVFVNEALAMRKELDLKKPLVYEDVRGHIENGIYRNESFGFTMNLKQPGFQYEVSNQEGYKYNFTHPTAIADDGVLLVYNADFSYTLTFYQSSVQSHVDKTAEAILGRALSQYKAVITKKRLGDKDVAYAQINDSGQVTEYYAMIVNGYYLKWRVKFANSNTENAEQLKAIVDSVQFDWSNK